VTDNIQIYTFIIADDHPLFRDAMSQIVQARYPGSTILGVSSIDEVSSTLSEYESTDLVLLDLTMPGVRGFSGLMYLRAQYPGVPVCIVSASEDPSIIKRSLEFGAAGFIPKSLAVEEMGKALDAILEGNLWTPEGVDLSQQQDDDVSALVQRLSTLTPQQVRVLMMLSEGLLNKQIAYELNVSEATVKAHVSAILQKLNVESRTQAVIAASKIEEGKWQALTGDKI
jgi:DNA-binding NarL/FixJ family response regulator